MGSAGSAATAISRYDSFASGAWLSRFPRGLSVLYSRFLLGEPRGGPKPWFNLF